MKSRKFWLCSTIALVTLAVVAGGCGRSGKPKDAAAEQVTEQATPVFVATAETGPIDEAEHLTGSVEALHEVDVQSEISGKVAWVGPQVGDHVSRGQALVRLDTALAAASARQTAAGEKAARAQYDRSRVGLKLTRDQTDSGLRQAEQNMEQARNRLRQAKVSADLTRTRVEEAITQAQIGVKQAQTQLADVRAGARTQEIAQAQARVEQSKSAVRLAKLSLDRAQSLVKGGAVAQAQLDAAQVEYETALANQRVAEQALDLAKEGARTEQVRLAELQVAQAEQALVQAQSQRAQIDVAERDVRAAEVSVDQAEEGVRLARIQRQQVIASERDVQAAEASVGQARAANQLSRTQIAKHIVYAPVAGEVAQRNVEPGEGASPGLSLIRIVALNPVRVNCEASELQVAHMRVGQQARVVVDALAGREFVGTITDIAPQAKEDQRIYIVRLEVANPQKLLRAGMFARVDVVTGHTARAVLVTRDALVEQGTRRVVYAVVDNRIKIREVTIGATEDSRVQITRGVRGGDMLVVGGQTMLADGELVKPEPRAKADGASPPAATPAGVQP
jgi:RND family efflux transporter MFP subunit